MIPRRTLTVATPPKLELVNPDNVSLVERRVIDWDFQTTTGPVSITLAEGDTINEQDDRFIISYKGGEVVNLYKAFVVWSSRRERTFSEPAPEFRPSGVKPDA